MELEQIINIYYLKRTHLLEHCKKHIDFINAEIIVDDLLIKLVQNKKGYSHIENHQHAVNYLFNSINKNTKRQNAINYHNQIPELTVAERDYWYQFTRDLFDNILDRVNNK